MHIDRSKRFSPSWTIPTPDLGRELRKQCADVIPVFRSDKYVKLTPAEKDAITGKIQDMVALIRRERIPLTAATSRDEYEWALRQALNAAQDDAFLRSQFQFGIRVSAQIAIAAKDSTGRPNAGTHRGEDARVSAMADNLLWVQQRESSRGKVLFFAHDAHVQTGPQYFAKPASHPPIATLPSVRETWLATVPAVSAGPRHGRHRHLFRPWRGFSGQADMPLPPDAAGMDGLLSSLSIPVFIMDLRELPSGGILHQWFAGGT
jgi:hypothetical protein